MKKAKLFLICPDCHIEQAIRNKYGDNAYFLTALGSVFEISAFEYAEEVNQFINNESIAEIVIVNDTQCRFIQNTVHKDKNHGTKTEVVLETLLKNNSVEFESLGLNEQRKLLSKLNIYRQAYELLEVTFIGNKIKNGTIELSGLIYNRENSDFEELKIELQESQHNIIV